MHSVLNVHRAGSSASMPFSLGPDSQPDSVWASIQDREVLSLPVKPIKVSVRSSAVSYVFSFVASALAAWAVLCNDPDQA